MAKEIEKVNGVAQDDIEKINGKTDANIENFNSFEFSAPSFGPPEVNNVSVNTISTGATSQTSSHPVGTGDGRVLIVGISQYNPVGQGSPAFPTGVTYGGTAMTRHAFMSGQEYNHLTLSIWKLVAPSTGYNNIVASFSATTTGASSIRAVSFSGCKQDSPVISSVSGSNNTGQFVSSGATTGVNYTQDSMTVGQFLVDFICIGKPGNAVLGYGANEPTSLAHDDGVTMTNIGSIASNQAGKYVEAASTSIATGWDWTDGGNSGDASGANYVWNTLKMASDVYS